MPLVNIPDHLYRRLEAFAPVGRAVLNDDVDMEGVTEIIIDAGLRSALNAIIQPQEESVLVQAFHQLAAAAPDLVYRHTADMLALGADVEAQADAQRRIGFSRQPVRFD